MIANNGLESFLSCSATVRVQDHSKTQKTESDQSTDLAKASDAIFSETGPSSLRNYHAKQGSALNILGIDPGNSGAIALLQLKKGQNSAIFAGVWDLPSKAIKGRKRLEIGEFSELVKSILQDKNLDNFIAAIEKVGQIRTEADPFSSFVFGFATGATHGVLAAAGIRIFPVTPLIWKTSLGLSSDKSKSIELATRLYPDSKSFLGKIKHHDRAEAILIAHFLSGVINRD